MNKFRAFLVCSASQFILYNAALAQGVPDVPATPQSPVNSNYVATHQAFAKTTLPVQPSTTQINLATASIHNRAPTPTDDGTGLLSSTGPCFASATLGYYLWGTFDADGVFQVFQSNSCDPGQAKWAYVPNPGLPEDAVPTLPLHGYSWSMKLNHLATKAFHLSDTGLVGSNGSTINFVGNYADYASADAFVAATPTPLANVPDYVTQVSGGNTFTSFAAKEALIDITYDETLTGTAYDSQETWGLITGTVTSSTGAYTNNTVGNITLSGSGGSQLEPAAIDFAATSGAPQNPDYASGSSWLSNGEWLGTAPPSTTQTLTSTTSPTGATATLTVVPYSQAPTWKGDNYLSDVLRGGVFNSVPIALSVAEQDYNKTMYVPIPINLSNATIITIGRETNGTQGPGSGLVEAPASGAKIFANVYSGTSTDQIGLSNSLGNCGVTFNSNPSFAAITWNGTGAGALKCRVGNKMNSGSTNGTTTLVTGLNIGPADQFQDYGHFVSAAWLISTVAPTPAQLQTLAVAASYAGHLHQQQKTMKIVFGASQQAGSGDTTNAMTPMNYEQQYLASIPYDLETRAIHGSFLCGSSNASTTTRMGTKTAPGPSMIYTFDPTYNTLEIDLTSINNDITTIADLATIKACYQTNIANAKTFTLNNGDAPHVHINPGPVQCGTIVGQGLTEYEAIMSWLNSPAAFQSVASGGAGLTPGYDKVTIMSNDPQMSPGYTIDGFGNITYSTSLYCADPASARQHTTNDMSNDNSHPNVKLAKIMGFIGTLNTSYILSQQR